MARKRRRPTPRTFARNKLYETISESRFQHNLCRDLGWLSVDRMMHGLSNREYMRWKALYTAEAAERQEQEEKQ